LPDPNVDGPYAYAEVDDMVDVAASGDKAVPIHCAYPTSGPAAGPYPVVVVGHGLALPASEYYGYLRRLASFGYVALTVDYPSSVTTVDNTAEVQDLLAGIDWAKASAAVGGRADTARVGMTGHSLGGKLALLAATLDPRVKAAIVLDPVDGGGPAGCTAPTCVEVAALMPDLHIPTGFLGETTDGAGGGMPCAPAASNYTTFYAKTNTPSLEVTVVGADHVSFVDDVSSCGFFCSLCSPGTATNAQVSALAHAYVAAFYERWLRGDARYDAYLTGAEAQARYVTTGQAAIASR
jgi:dienelactone hydrolase